jgi:hypothetical protein
LPLLPAPPGDCDPADEPPVAPQASSAASEIVVSEQRNTREPELYHNGPAWTPHADPNVERVVDVDRAA